jgi:hypothetical protein
LKKSAYTPHNCVVFCTGFGDFHMVLVQWKIALHWFKWWLTIFFKGRHNYSMFHCIPFPPCNIQCPSCGVHHVLWQIQLISDCSEWQNRFLPHIGFWWRCLSFHFYINAIFVLYIYVLYFVSCKQLCSCCINFLVFLPNIHNFIMKIPDWAC